MHFAKTEASERLLGRVAIANDERDHSAWIEIGLSDASDLVGGDGAHVGNELLEVRVRQIEQRELRDRTRDLLRGLEIPWVAARQ